jgi:olefin beta-lactone synthetase
MTLKTELANRHDFKAIEPWSLESLQNVGHCVSETARRMPDAIAVATPRKNWRTRQSGLFQRLRNQICTTKFDTINFEELDRYSDQIAATMQAHGVPPGTRIALMIPPGIEFVAWVFGLFKAGVVIILIDPGMGRKNLIRCLAEAEPNGMVGIALAHAIRQVMRSRLPNCKLNFVLGRWPGCVSVSRIRVSETGKSPIENHDREQPAAIIFTTGSTGPPKGVLYRHRHFIEQACQIRDYFQIAPGTVDVSGFPLFALFNTAMGATTVFPKMDATRPADIHPPEFIHAVESFNANQSFGSPALWNTVCKYCELHSLRLPSIARVMSAGAPVPASLLERIKYLIADHGDAFTPYGATEALPVSCISASEVLNETAAKSAMGAGTCVGKPFPKMEWQVIEITDQPLGSITECEILGSGKIGELIVSGSIVTDQYVTRTEANAFHKICDGEGFWHRMGDVGYLDEHNRFWFCGRKSQRVQTDEGTMFTVPCEALFNNHPKIYRSALVGISSGTLHPGPSAGLGNQGFQSFQIPAIVAEPHPQYWSEDSFLKNELIRELKAIASQHELTRSIKHILLRKNLPVDIRHNSKIFREKLRPWVSQQILKMQ